MRLFPPELEIGPDEGFTPEKDIFKRKEFGDQVTRIVRALEGPAVLLLDAPWGSGKTTFVKMWRGELTKAGIPSIYFDAFANDYHENGFLTLAGEIIARAEEEKPGREKAVAAFKETAVKVAKVLGRAGLRLGTRVATAGVLTGDEIDLSIKLAADTVKAAGDEAGKAIDELLKQRLESHHADRQLFEEFGEALKELVADLTRLPAEEAGAAGTEKAAPFIFIIDELDRCRPTFALELLEKVKHFFSVPDVIFVLVTNLQQLQAAVRFAYGADVDARTYLEKFYHLRLVLPGPSRQMPLSAHAVYLRYLFDQVLPKSDDGRFVADLEHVIEHVARVHVCSLRTVERIGAYCALVIASTNRNMLRLAPIIGGLCALRVIAPSLYDAARQERLSYGELQDVLRFSEWRDAGSQEIPRAAVACGNWWKFVLGEDLDKETVDRLSQVLWHFSLSRASDMIALFCRIIDGLTLPEQA